MTRFGGYAEYAVTNASGVAIIPDQLDAATATALTTQYCTAFYAASEMVNLHKGNKVLIQSGVRGVVMKMYKVGIFKSEIAKVFNANKITEAHDFLETRKSIGKVVVQW